MTRSVGHIKPSIYAKAQRERKEASSVIFDAITSFFAVGRPVLPENVSAQLCIWEEERRRIRMHKACVLEFAKEQDLDVFPTVVARSQHRLIMHTDCPPTTDPNSEQVGMRHTLVSHKKIMSPV